MTHHLDTTAPAAQERLITQDELADLLQVPVRTIEDWRQNDYGPPCIRLGRRVRYRVRSVYEWLDRLEAGS